MVTIMIGRQASFTKFPCYLCLWNSRVTGEHYLSRDSTPRTVFNVRKKIIKWEPLLDFPWEIFFPTPHIKLGLIKQFVSILDQESIAFRYLKDKAG